MWITNQLGVATWSDDVTEWEVDARGGQAISIGPGDEAAVQLRPVEDSTLPAADEQFVRGCCWNINYPQAEHRHALRIEFEPIEVVPNSMLLEATISIQTDLLDSHPKIDIRFDGELTRRLSIPGAARHPASQAGSAGVTVANSDTNCVAILLGPHDSPFTTDLSTPESLRLRLFGEFLEKGVIRKARPWILIRPVANEPSDSELHAISQRLADRPLPLAF